MGKTVSKVTSPRKRVWFSKEFKLEARRLYGKTYPDQYAVITRLNRFTPQFLPASLP